MILHDENYKKFEIIVIYALNNYGQTDQVKNCSLGTTKIRYKNIKKRAETISFEFSIYIHINSF